MSSVLRGDRDIFSGDIIMMMSLSQNTDKMHR